MLFAKHSIIDDRQGPKYTPHLKQPPKLFYKRSCSYKFRNNQREKPVLESLLNKVAGLEACNFIKKRL